MSWPPTWSEPHFKAPAGTVQKGRKRIARTRKKTERTAKQKVRLRDKRCRFPLCACHRTGHDLHVSHQRHKGSGGNPKGDRSTTAGMVLVCQPRHQGSFGIDTGRIRWRALTEKGADGPILWERRRGDYWIELARERDIRVWEPFTPEQRAILKGLAEEMKR